MDVLGKIEFQPSNCEEIPLLPVSAFKHNTAISGNYQPEVIYLSSTTSGGTPSKHLVRSEEWYLDNARKCFESVYGDVGDYAVFALLPSYLERKGSSLIKMADFFIQSSNYVGSGFFLDDYKALNYELEKVKNLKIPTIFLGVSFALLDFSEIYNLDLKEIIVMETGGMKGRKKEIPRDDLHNILSGRFNVEKIHSEYGMTEMLSQAYSTGDGIFAESYSIKIMCKQITDPLQSESQGKSGLMGIIDVANIDSCAFLLTDDLGRKVDSTHFEVLGRSDNSEIRGCNLMISDL